MDSVEVLQNARLWAGSQLTQDGFKYLIDLGIALNSTDFYAKSDLYDKIIDFADSVKWTPQSLLKDYMFAHHPSDDMIVTDMNDSVTIQDAFDEMVTRQDHDIYDVMGVSDSVVREEVFDCFEDVLGVDYDDSYTIFSGDFQDDFSKQMLSKDFRETGTKKFNSVLSKYRK